MRVKTLCCLFIVCIFCYAPLAAQSLKSYTKAAQKSIAEGDFYTAQFYLRKALVIEPESSELQYNYALTAFNFHAYTQAKDYFTKVIKGKNRPDYPEAFYWLGQCAKTEGNYKEAKANFARYIQAKSTKKDKILLQSAQTELKTCDWASKQKPVDTITVAQLGKAINSPYSEFAPYLAGDTLYYSSYRFLWKNDKQEPARRLTKVLYSFKKAKGRTLRYSFNIPEKHTAHTAFSTKGDRVYFTICEFTDGAQIRCKLYYRDKNRRGKWQKKAIPLPEFINSDSFTNTHPTVGYDKTRKKEVLIFASDRPGGKGKKDLWLSEIDGNKFGKPENLAVVNTPEDDLSPFWHSGSQTLWFSSKGYPSFGGFDIFSYLAKENKVVNAGLPINSSFNDLYFHLSSNSKKAVLSSNRPGSYFLDRENENCCNDIYELSFLPRKEEIPQDSIPASPPLTEKLVLSSKPKEPETLQDFLPLALYFDNDEPDRRTRRTTTKKTYTETFDSYYARKYEYLSEYAAPLEEEERYAAEEKMTDFFEDKVKKGQRYLFLFSDILLKRLQQNERVEIFVKGFTSPRAQSDYNVNLGKRRISSVRNHFAEYAGGVFQEYLEKGKLIITERSFGETTASNQVSDDLEDVRNSVYSIDAARERRVELVELEINSN